MPGPDKIKENLTKVYEQLQAYYASMAQAASGDVVFQQILESLSGYLNTLHSVCQNGKNLGPNTYSSLNNNMNNFLSSTMVFMNNNDYDSLGESQKNTFKSLVSSVKLVRNNYDQLQSVKDAYKSIAEFKASFIIGRENQNIQNTMNTFGLSGHRPSLQECQFLSVKDDQPEHVIDRLLWLNNQEHKGALVSPEFALQKDSIYQKANDRIADELKNAPHKLQANYATRLFLYETALKDKLSQKYTSFLQEAKDRKTIEEKKNYAMEKLAKDPLYSNLTAFEHLKSKLSGSRFAELYDHLSGDPEAATMLNKREGAELITGFVSGRMDQFLGDKGLADAVKESNARAYRDELVDSVYRKDSKVSRLGEVYERIINDKEKASESFVAMQVAMSDVAEMEHVDITNQGEYMKRLSMARDAAKIYLEKHQGNRHTRKGKDRIAMANDMVNALDAQIEKVNLERAHREEETIGKIQTDKTKSEAEKLREIAKLRKHIAPVKITPKEPKFSAAVTKGMEAKGWIKHQLYTLLYMKFGLGLGQIIDWVARPFNKKVKAPQITTTLDLDRIPGRHGERFNKNVPREVAEGPDNQKILCDKRRPPLAWEVPIPEDPNQPPTVTFEFDQGREGDSVGYAYVKNKDGSWDHQMGHGIVTLQYTKNNPFTGQPERYKASFGFYPKGGFVGMNIMAAQAMKGMTVPGQMNNDFNHDVSTGTSYIIDNKKVNSIILAAQQYEKDGYNYFDRNCTTFVHDMAEVAGIDLSEIMKPVDLTSEKKNKEYAGMIIAGTLLSRLGKRDALNKGGRLDQSYQRNEQHMINAEDVKRMNKSDYVINKRMKGYAPGHTAESVRVSSNFKLHSTKYAGSLEISKEEIEASPHTEHKRIIEAEMPIFKGAIISHALKNGMSQSETNELVDKIDAYMNNMSEALFSYGDAAFQGRNSEGEISFAEQKKALMDTSKTITEFVDGLDEIYKNTFKRDPELNIPFQHMVSVLERYKKDTEYAYSEFGETRHVYDAMTNMQVANVERMKELVDSGRDSFQALRAYKFGLIHITDADGHDKSFGISKTVALAQAFGSLREGIEKMNKLESYKAREKIDDDLNTEETKDKENLERMEKLVMDFEKAQEAYVEDRVYTENDYRFAFIEIPELTNGVEFDKKNMKPDEVYQNIALEHILGGSKARIQAGLEPVVTDLKNRLAKGEKLVKNKNAELTKMKKALQTSMCSAIADKIKGNQAEMDKFVKIAAEKMILDNPYEPAANPSKNAFNKKISQKVFNFIADKICNVYMKPLAEDIVKEAAGNDKNLNFLKDAAKSLVDVKSLKNEPAFKKLHDAINRKLGINPEKKNEQAQRNNEIVNHE